MTEYLPDPSSPYELLLEASISEDPSFSLKQLKDSIIRRQQYGEVTIDQIQEHLEMEQWVEMEKRKAEGELRWYKSDKRYSINTKLAFLYACITFGAIGCHLVYNLYLGQELPKKLGAASLAIMIFTPYFAHLAILQIGGRDDWVKPLYNENYNSISVSNLKQRQLELIDCYLNQVLPMKAEIPASRYRHDVLAMIIGGEWTFYAFFHFCNSICDLSYNWSNEKVRKVDSTDIVISGAVFLLLSVWLIYFWHSSKLARRPVKHTKVGVQQCLMMLTSDITVFCV
ncbi:hypothetical protein GCK72_016795 [Caenorhabditis remanei]|uniref:Uncharacterized protein n=1 Tax=Caenorhabditis remanei TaxID=31234 RepID=A0A6A5G5E5_CAERE|nr:hypothetical protein GCK72_016795 [Caenorhabditis remanei]KAF1750248.1 hypothetical protein GCK72_016795 [Caenorhabditis remanei]